MVVSGLWWWWREHWWSVLCGGDGGGIDDQCVNVEVVVVKRALVVGVMWW